MHVDFSLLPVKKTLNCNGRLIDLTGGKIMGVLNTTPDSFFDGGYYNSIDEQLKQVEKMLKDGADFIDIGGVSTRPGASEVSEAEELDRTIPVIETILANFPVTVISIDTWRSHVAAEAVRVGAAIVNDVSGGNEDENMIATVASLGVPYICMHKKGRPENMQIDPQYEDVTKEIIQYFSFSLDKFKAAGIKDVILDPGFGFGKTLTHNFELLKKLHLMRMLGCPVMAGLSRKSMINKLLKTKPQNALNGTTIVNTLAVLQGADILRVHDVKQGKEVLKIMNYYCETV
jgi:dihydropteroate synthase